MPILSAQGRADAARSRGEGEEDRVGEPAERGVEGAAKERAPIPPARRGRAEDEDQSQSEATLQPLKVVKVPFKLPS